MKQKETNQIIHVRPNTGQERQEKAALSLSQSENSWNWEPFPCLCESWEAASCPRLVSRMPSQAPACCPPSLWIGCYLRFKPAFHFPLGKWVSPFACTLISCFTLSHLPLRPGYWGPYLLDLSGILLQRANHMSHFPISTSPQRNLRWPTDTVSDCPTPVPMAQRVTPAGWSLL